MLDLGLKEMWDLLQKSIERCYPIATIHSSLSLISPDFNNLWVSPDFNKLWVSTIFGSPQISTIFGFQQSLGLKFFGSAQIATIFGIYEMNEENRNYFARIFMKTCCNSAKIVLQLPRKENKHDMQNLPELVASTKFLEPCHRWWTADARVVVTYHQKGQSV